MTDSIDVNQNDIDPNDGWRVSLDRGVSLAVFELTLRSQSQTVATWRLAELSLSPDGDNPDVNALFFLAQAFARFLNTGCTYADGSWLIEQFRRLPQLTLPKGYRLLGVAEEVTRQNLFNTENGVRVVTEDQWADTMDASTLVNRLHNELIPYVDPFADTEVPSEAVDETAQSFTT